ncbi:hypothetical protein CPJCM30710_13420 [Clostridium polyendosporum]|uniref:Solute-binding protein family 5 domain-containing protein n=2 Tax=Clostridium polyendosporum TaxID=69208 RepID=A0A919RZQ7_9CLOT|nr:hypothetical protein CPJCM30710_13420 [Clostridium polyendosporum]
MAFPTYFPVRQDIVGKDKEGWASKPETFICNGPFKMKEWKSKDSLVFVKNENYWNAKEIKLETIEYKMIEEATSALSTFRQEDLDLIDEVPRQEVPQLIKDGVAKIEPYLGTYFYVLNISLKAKDVDLEAAKALADPRARKALK